jgi:predicted Rossmann fold nucleotide-binding protein DprA/Smf involved in DNA uptake
MKQTYLGNKELLKLHKIGFFCSRTVSGSAVLHCYDWATEIDIEHQVIVSGFQSKIEKDVLHLLRKRHAKMILVLARSIYKKMPEELQPLLDDGSLLIVSTASAATRTAKSAADHRNEYIAQTCDELVFGYIGEGSSLQMLFQGYKEKSVLL